MLLALFAIGLFEIPALAVGIAGASVSVPVIIHLLNRKRFKVVTWAAMRFLLAAQRKNARRMRLEQLLLLLVRCAIVLFTILAMLCVTPWAEAVWRWWSPEAGKAMVSGGQRTHKILVLDGSLSMNVKVGDTTFFDRARALATKMVQESSGDGFSVVLMAAPPRRIVPEPSENAPKVVEELRALRPTHGNADLPATLATVASLLNSSPGKFAAKEVYFLTDVQQATWITRRPGDLATALKVFHERHARTILLDVGQDGVHNLTVANVELLEPVATTGREVPILVTLHNFGDTRDDVNVRLLVGKAPMKANEKLDLNELHQADRKTVPKVERGQQATVVFTYRFPTAGDYVLQVQTDGDALEADDVRSVVVTVKNIVPVLLVNGKPAPEAFDRATEWLDKALNPFDDGGQIPPFITARPKVLTPLQFADETTGNLADYDCVFLCDVPRFSPGEVRRLEAHVRRGGGVVFCMGDKVDFGAYNDALYKAGQGLLPARLVEKRTAGRTFAYQFDIPQDGDRLDPLKAFRSALAREQLLSPRFRAFVLAEPPSASRGGAVPRRILSFVPAPIGGLERAKPAITPTGGPAMLEWQPPSGLERGAEAGEGPGPRLRGRVVLITTTVNADWNNWPASRAYLPLMNEVLNFATSARLREQSYNVAEPLELFLPVSAAGANVKVEVPRDPSLGPTGRKEGDDGIRRIVAQPLGDGNVARWADTDVRGVYRMTVGQDPREYLFAVNVPARTEEDQTTESNLARTTQEDLRKTYPEWDIQVVTELGQIERTVDSSAAPAVFVFMPQGPPKAHVLLLLVLLLVLAEVVIAFVFGHYSTVPKIPDPQLGAAGRGLKEWALIVAPVVLFGALFVMGLVLIHNAITGDFLGFLPDGARQLVERVADVPSPAPGEGSRWRLEFASYFVNARADLWLGGALAVLATALIAFVYRHEGQAPGAGFRAMLVGLRVGVLLLLLTVFLPQLSLHFERQGWPDVAIVIDESQSMSALDAYRDPRVKAAADALAEKGKLANAEDLPEPEKEERARLYKALSERPDLTKAERLRLVKALLSKNGPNGNWLATLVTKRRVRLHVYRCSGRAQRFATVTSEDEVKKALADINDLQASSDHDSSQLGGTVRQVLNDFRGSSLAAVVMLTDGVTTEGEDLGKVSKYAAQMGVPLYFVGVGDSQEQRDVYLHDLSMEEVIWVNDRLNVDLKLTAQGYGNIDVPVSLWVRGTVRKRVRQEDLTPEERVRLLRKELKEDEKGLIDVDRELPRTKLETKTVKVPAGGNPLKLNFLHKPTEPGELIYEVEAAVQPGEVKKENNRIERAVSVREAKPIKVLYVEGYRRYEYHYLKTLLGRESGKIKGNKTVDLKVFLLDADPDFPVQDRPITLDSFPTKDELKTYDAVILGDVSPDPIPGQDNTTRIVENLKDIAEFVTERGGGLLVIAGERYMPRAYRNSPLKNVLPIDVLGGGEDDGDDGGIVDPYRAELTPVGKLHPIFRLHNDEKESAEIWGRLREMFWYANGYEPKRAAEVLAVHPKVRASGRKVEGGAAPDRHPLVVQQFVGSGRVLFFGFNETWRWNWREDQVYYNEFWNRTLKYLARSKLGRVDLRLDRQTDFRRGEPIKIIVRFPDDAPPPPDNTEVKVLVERKAPGAGGQPELRTVQLARLTGSRATYEALLTQTPEGDYKFWLAQPTVPAPRPRAECKVLAPPSEMEQLRMNQAEMELAAGESRGKFYNLADADKLLDELPTGSRVTVNTSGPPALVWNSVVLFLLMLGLLTTEWLLRKQKNLL